MFAMQTGYAAVDDIKFMDCAFPRKIGACNRLQTRCDNGACINPEKVNLNAYEKYEYGHLKNWYLKSTIYKIL